MSKPGIREMKRLYLREAWWGKGIARRLAERCLSFACGKGYTKIRLDTERHLETAIRMYGKLGFREIGRYYESPIEDMLFIEKEL